MTAKHYIDQYGCFRSKDLINSHITTPLPGYKSNFFYLVKFGYFEKIRRPLGVKRKGSLIYVYLLSDKSKELFDFYESKKVELSEYLSRKTSEYSVKY